MISCCGYELLSLFIYLCYMWGLFVYSMEDSLVNLQLNGY